MPIGDGFFATTDLNHLLHREKNLTDILFHLVALDPTVDGVPDLLLLTGEGVQNEPLGVHGQSAGREKCWERGNDDLKKP